MILATSCVTQFVVRDPNVVAHSALAISCRLSN